MMRASRNWLRAVLVVGIAGFVYATAWAQTTTKKTDTVHFTVIGVQGNTVTVKTQEQGAREVTVDDSFRFTVDGNPVGVHDLKPGMKGTATITTTTTYTPVVVTEVKEGTVQKVVGSTIIVYTGGEYKMFTQEDLAKRGVKIMKDGQSGDLSALREGDKLTATIVTEHPPKIMTKRQVDASMTGAPASAPAAAPRASSTSGAAAASASGNTAAAGDTAGAGAHHKKLPKTASEFPLIGLLGASLCAFALMLGVVRRQTA